MENAGNMEADNVRGYFDDPARTGARADGTFPSRTVSDVLKS
jgi:hypothetical protein